MKNQLNNIGTKRECFFSSTLHAEEIGIPLLVSPTLLRKNFMGQIDLALMKAPTPKKSDWELIIYEIKGQEIISDFQKRRIKDSGTFLQHIFKVNIFFELIHENE